MLRIYGVGRGRRNSDSTKTTQEEFTDSKRKTAGELRVQKELEDLELPGGFTIDFPDKNNLMSFELTVRPENGFWKHGTFRFSFNVPETYPHDPPKAKCLTKIFHPNIDEDGNICLNILREDWKPVLCLNGVLYGLLHLFLEPNTENPLNEEAANMLANQKHHFARTVSRMISEG